MNTFSALVGGDSRRPTKIGGIDLNSMTAHVREQDGRLVKFDLTPADVHIPAAEPNYAAGYRLQEAVADKMSEPVIVTKPTNYLWTWDKATAFQEVESLVEGPGGAIPEVNPSLTKAQFTTSQYVLGCFISTETEAGADASITPDYVAMIRIMNAMHQARERRVFNLAYTGSGSNWNSGNVINLAAGAKWNGGASSDPIANINAIIQASAQDVTGIVMNTRVYNDFWTNSQVQKYIQFKPAVPGGPTPEDLSKNQAFARLPPIIEAKMRTQTATGTDYLWPDACFLFRATPGLPVDQQSISTFKTLRWSGLPQGQNFVKDQTSTLPDGIQAINGWTVRKFFHQYRGARGGLMTVVTVNDAEFFTSNIVGGVILGTHQ